jgi:hypothetical protein
VISPEVMCATKQKGLAFIKPVTIEGPPLVPPPKALAKPHFNDWLQYMIRAEETAHGTTTARQ